MYDLGDKNKARVNVWDDEAKVDIRQWGADKNGDPFPEKKGTRLTLGECQELLRCLPTLIAKLKRH